MNVKDHNQVANSGSGLITIREIFISKCPYYYQFEEIMGTSPNVAPPFLVESGHLDRITEEPIEDIDTQTYEKFIQAGQDTVDKSETIPIDPSLLPSSAQGDSIFLGINPDDLDESQASLQNTWKEK